LLRFSTVDLRASSWKYAAAWLLGVTVREYRELEAGARFPSFETWNAICKLYGWPQTFAGKAESRAL
jgi:hypothetical protein